MHRMVLALLALVTSIFFTAEARAVDLTGLKGLGGSIGSSLVIGDWQFRQFARPRFAFDGVFKYGLKPNWVFTTFFGYQWNSYATEERWLNDIDLVIDSGFQGEPQERTLALWPFTAGIEYRFGSGERVPYVGAGGGIYVTDVYLNRSVAHDPRFRSQHRRLDPGIYGRVGMEQFLSDVMSLDYEALLHVVFSEDREKFPDPTGSDLDRFGDDFKTYGGDGQWLQIRIGLRYYWGGGL